MSAGTVYFIQAGVTGPVKIGYSHDPVKRLATLQSGHYEPLTLLGFCDGAERTEARLHEELAEHRLSGEWFTPHADVLAAIEKPAAPLLEAVGILESLTPILALTITRLRGGNTRDAEEGFVAIEMGLRTVSEALGFEPGEVSPAAQSLLARIDQSARQFAAERSAA